MPRRNPPPGHLKQHDECRWNYRLSPSRSRVRIPSGPPLWTRSSADRAGRFAISCRHDQSVQAITRNKPRRMPDGTTAQSMGQSEWVRLPSLQALSGTSGTPMFHPFLSPWPIDMPDECRRDYRVERSKPMAARGRMFKSSPHPNAVAQQKCPAIPCRRRHILSGRMLTGLHWSTGGSNPPCLRAVASRQILVARAA